MSELVRFLSGDNDVAQKTQMDPQNPTAKFVPLEPGQVLFGLEVVEDGSLLGTIYYDYKDKNGIITRVSMGNGGAGGSGGGGGIIKTLATTDGKHESDEVTATANTIIPLPKKIFANLLSAKTQFNFPKVHDPSNTAYVNEDAAPGQSYLYGNGLHMINPFNTLQDSWIRTIGKSGSAEATFELAMRDNASNEYIYDQIVARHYKADGTIVTDTDGHKREVVILGKEGESQFPGPVTSQRGFVGDVDGNAKSATKAKQDWYDQVIDSTYLSKIVKTTHNGSKFEITSYDGRYTPVGSADAKKDVITIPGATTTLAGLVTTGDQTITGNKTINSSGTLTIMKQGGFIYSGIQEDKATNKNLPIWFSTGTANGTPNYSTELTYNPSTGTVTAKKFAGPATSATYDAEGGAIHDKYLKRAGGTMTGALKFADNTYNAFGDDIEIGSQNAAGKLNIHGKNGATGIVFVPYSGSTSQTISIDGAGVMTITGTVKTTLKGNADTATKLKTARNFNITDSSAAYSGPNVSFDGSADVTLHMPDTFAGTLKGNADTATKLKTARTLWGQSFNGTANISGNMTGVGNVTSTKTNTYTLGTSSNLWKAVYATTFYGALSGNANTATKLQTARSFHITDSSATYNGVSATFDGSAAITLHMPDTFVGTLKGHADSSTRVTISDGSSDAERKILVSSDSTSGQNVYTVPGITANYAKKTLTAAGGFIGNASSASKLQTAKKFTITDSSAAYTGASASFDGTSDVTLHMPSTFAGTLVGDASRATLVKYSSTLASNDAINNFLEANILKVAIWKDTSFPGVSNGIILSGGWTSTSYGFQLAIDDDPTWYIALRQKGTNGWGAWKRIPMGDGTGASGTWGISITGNAATASAATKLATARSFHITDSSATYNGANASFDGTGDVTLHMPSTFAGTLKGNADSATIARSLGADNGMKMYAHYSNEINFGGTETSTTLYFGYRATDSRPIPAKFVFGGSTGTATLVAATFQGALSGNATSATKLQTARNFHITDSSATYNGPNASFNGTADITLHMPSTFAGTLKGNADSATKATKLSMARAQITTTTDLDAFLEAGVVKYTTVSSNIGVASDGMVLSLGWGNGSWGHQIFADDSAMVMQHRHRLQQTNSDGTKTMVWSSWSTLLDSANYTSYTVKKDGTGATGTWGINISGNAATATQAQSALKDGDLNEITTTYLKRAGGTMTGSLIQNTHTNTTPLIISRAGGTSEAAAHGVDDSSYHIVYTNDEAASQIRFRFINTDTEGSDGTNKSDRSFYLTSGGAFLPNENNQGSIGTSSIKWANIYATTFNGALSGNAATATKWATSRNFQVDLALDNPATVKVDGTKDVILPVTGILATKHGGTGNSSHTANRLVWSETATKLSATNNHYANASKIAVNYTSAPSTNFYVNGTSYLNGNTTINGQMKTTGPLLIGSDANGRTKNYIAFYGITGDGPDTWNHTFIGENLFGDSDKSELILFKGNDPGSTPEDMRYASGPGPDRIRHIAAGHLFQIYRTALSGTFATIAQSAVPISIFEVNQQGVVVYNEGTDANNYPAKITFRVKDTINGTTSTATIAAYSDHGTASYGSNLVISSGGNTLIQAGDGTYGSYANLIGSGVNQGENLYLTADSSIQLCAAADTANRKLIWDGTTFYPSISNTFHLGSKSYRWASAHVYRDFNIYGTESTGDESHVRFCASDNNQRAIIAFNGNTTNTLDATTHLKIATNYGDIRLDAASNYINVKGHILPRADFTATNYNIGSTTRRWGNVYANALRLQGPSSDPSEAQGARIEFAYDNGTNRSQPVYISYTPNDSYRAPYGLKIFGTEATNYGAWLEVQGAIGTSSTNLASGIGISLYGGPKNGKPEQGIFYGATGTFGQLKNTTSAAYGVTTNAMYLTVADVLTHGWLFMRGSTNVAGVTGNGTFLSVVSTGTHIAGNQGKVIIDGTAGAGYNMLFRQKSTNGVFTGGAYNAEWNLYYTSNSTISAGTNGTSYGIRLINEAGNTRVNRLGINGEDVNYRLYVNGTSHLTSTVRLESHNQVGFIFRQGTGYDTTLSYLTSGNEAMVFATKNAVTSFIFINGEDSITNHAADRWTKITPALQIKKNSVYIGSLIGEGVTPAYKFYVNGTTYLNGATTVSSTITAAGMIRCNGAPIFGYRFSQSNNAPAFVFDKPGSNYTGIGANGASDTIYFGAVGSDGNWNWVTSYKQKWQFNGTVIADTVSTSSLAVPGGYVKTRENGTSYNCLGSYYAGGSTATYIRIALPSFSGWNMCQLEFSIRQAYDSGRAGKLIVYAHTSGSSSNWTQFYAVYHDRLTSAIKVYGSDNRYFYIAGVSAWGGLTLDKMVLGDAVTGADMSNVVIDGVSALPATYQTATMLRSWVQGDSVTSAVWNDYAEYRKATITEAGYVLYEMGDDSLEKTTERLQHFAGVSSDTWGFSQGETEKAKTPIAVAGRVLVYPYQDRDNYQPGDCVCAAPGGTVDIMTREEVIRYPDRIVGTVSCVPNYEEWGGGEGADRDSVKVNGRIWIKVR